MALTTVNSDGVKDDSIKNIDVKSDAAIAGTKISPDFGSQNIVTTGTVGIGTGSGTTASAGYDEFVIQGGDADIGMNFLSPAANNRTHTIAFGDSNNNNAGKIQYNHSTDDLTISASDNIILTGDKIGIGTTSPVEELHVKGQGTVAKFEGTGGSGFISLADADDNTQLFLGCDGGSFKVQTSGNGWADKLTVNVAGHIGLKTAPNSGWSVSTDINVLQLKNGVLWDYAGVQLDIGHNFYYTGSGYKFIYGNYATRITQHNNDGHIGFWSGGTGSADGDITWVEQMHIKANGNVGIGLSDPDSYYAKDLVIKVPDEGGMTIRNTGANDWNYIMFANGTSNEQRYAGWIAYDHGDNKLKIAVNNHNTGKGFEFQASGNFELNDGNLVVASGHGIDFSAAPDNASGETVQSSVLDDYETGYFTLAWAFSTSGSAGMTADRGSYVKVGDIVHVTFEIATSSTSSPSGTITITGLPFTAAGLGGNYAGGAIGFARDWATDMPNLRVNLDPNSSTLNLYKHATNANESSTSVQGSDMASGSAENYVGCTLTYRAA